MPTRSKISTEAGPKPRSPQWFEMADLRKRRFANSVWIPLRATEKIWAEGKYGIVGSAEESLAVNCTAFPISKKEEAEKLDWSHLGLIHSAGPYAFREGGYKPAEVFQYHEKIDLGIDLVFPQSFTGERAEVWLLNQDLVLALRLKSEGDVWVRPSEGYIEVVRQRRDGSGRVISLEIRAEHLRDYLAARGLALRVSYYRQRMAVLPDLSGIPWAESPPQERKPHDRYQAGIFEVSADGGLPGGVALFRFWRTDVDDAEDVPVIAPEDDSNTAGESSHFERAGTAYRVEGELWRSEWIEPATLSERVRGDEPAERLFYMVGAGGEKLSDKELDDEDIGRWLWFNPGVIETLLKKRGSGLEWYSYETGQVWCSPGCGVHFGVNGLGLITVYARDVACLEQWQQRIWLGFNVSPEGGVSAELLSSQMRADPASTLAPELKLMWAITALDDAIKAHTGEGLFRTHPNETEIFRSVHRFRSLDETSMLSLAKDIARLIVDRMSVTALSKIVTPQKGAKWGSLKWLENALATVLGADVARTTMSPLFGLYEMRLADAHLPSADESNAIASIGIDGGSSSIQQAEQLIDAIAETLAGVAAAFARP